MNILGAFTGRNSQLKYRGFVKTCNRISAAYACNRLTPYIKKGDTLCINILSLVGKRRKNVYLTIFPGILGRAWLQRKIPKSRSRYPNRCLLIHG